MKILKGILKAVGAVIVVILVIGIVSPKHYSGELEKELNHSPQEVWDVLTNIEGVVDRRREIVSMEITHESPEGFHRWKEYTDLGGFASFEITERVEPERFVVVMKESTFGITGEWSYMLMPHSEEGKTIILLSEESDTSNILVRSIMTMVGRGANLKWEFVSLENTLEQ